MGGAALFVAFVAVALLGLLIVGALALRGALWTKEMSTDAPASDEPPVRPEHIRVEDDGTRGPAGSKPDPRR